MCDSADIYAKKWVVSIVVSSTNGCPIEHPSHHQPKVFETNRFEVFEISESFQFKFSTGKFKKLILKNL